MALFNVIEVFMALVPSVIDLSTLMDFLTDFVKALPLQSTKLFAEFIYNRSSFFIKNFKELEISTTNAKIVQTSGAKMIGLIRVFEFYLKEYTTTDVSVCIFNLRILLSSCLPISHLGLCNRQCVSADFIPLVKVSESEWHKIGKHLFKEKCEGLSEYEINCYEAAAINTGSAKTPQNQIFDIKAMATKIEVSSAPCDSFKTTSYEIYSHYCDVANFIFQPDIVGLLNMLYMYYTDCRKKP